jgi:pimeloyl-ACP methyl ester carboxylesterase
MTRKFRTLRRGNGQGIVFLHGMMGAAENFQQVLQALPAGCGAAALEIPFFAEGAELNTLDAMDRYVTDFLDSGGYDRVVLGGNSLGGHISLHLALAMPDRIAGLILTGSSGLFERDLGSHRGANPDRTWYRNKMKEIFYDPAHVTEELVDLVVDTLESRRCRRVLVSMAKSAKRDNLADRLGEISCPTLLIWGREDGITPPEVAEEFRQRIPGSELCWLDKCGHAAMLERPEGFAQAVCRWWNEHFSTPASRLSGGAIGASPA